MCRGAAHGGAQKGCKCERRAHRHHRKVMAAPVIGPGTYEFGGTSSNLVSKKLGRIFGPSISSLSLRQSQFCSVGLDLTSIPDAVVAVAADSSESGVRPEAEQNFSMLVIGIVIRRCISCWEGNHAS
jgi:hypothetical protein